MSLVTSTIPHLINGVSQQPASNRLLSQCEEQINARSNVVQGLTKRPPADLLAKIDLTNVEGAKVHVYDRGDDEKYIIVITETGTLKVYDFEGNEKTVSAPHGTSYLRCPNPREHLKAVSIADYTFILNTQRKVRARTTGSSSSNTPVKEDQYVITVGEARASSRYKYREKWETVPMLYRAKVTTANFIRIYPSRSRSVIIEKTARQVKDNYPIKPSYWDLLNPSFYHRPTASHDFRTKEYGDVPDQAEFAAQLASTLRRFKYKVSQYGNRVIVHLRPGQASPTVSDQSLTPVWHRDAKAYYYDNKPAGESYITTQLKTNVTVGYEDSNGDSVPTRNNGNPSAVVYIKQGNYDSTYNIEIDGVVQASYTTSPTTSSTIRTDVIASNLLTQLQTNLPTGWSFTQKGSSILLARSSSTDFDIKATDSLGDTGSVAIKGTIGSTEDLPAVCFEGFTVEVLNSDGAADNYYLEYTESGNENNAGIWKEVVGVNEGHELSDWSMPYQLISNADGTFTFTRATWATRQAGDRDSNPLPSFVNDTLTDIFFWKNRLGFLHGESVSLSEHGNIYNFFRTTMINLLDTAPIIDATVSNDRVSLLKHALTLNEDLFIFSDKTQFRVRGNELLTNSTIGFDITTRFDASMTAKPAGLGKNIYIPILNGDWAGVKEYFASPENDTYDAITVTAHVPNYIAGDIVAMTASTNEDTLVVKGELEPNILAVYDFHWQGQEKVQSSWSKWKFRGDIIDTVFVGSDLVVLTWFQDDLWLLRINMAHDSQEDVSAGYQAEVHLDYKVDADAGSAMPYNFKPTEFVDEEGITQKADMMFGVGKDGSIYAGYDDIASALATKDLIIGISYNMEYVFSPFFLKPQGSPTARADGRVQIRHYRLAYADSGAFQVQVTPYGRDTYTYKYTGRILGSIDNIIGQTPNDSGVFKVPIQSNARDVEVKIVNESHLPSNIQFAEVDVVYHPRGRRM